MAIKRFEFVDDGSDSFNVEFEIEVENKTGRRIEKYTGNVIIKDANGIVVYVYQIEEEEISISKNESETLYLTTYIGRDVIADPRNAYHADVQLNFFANEKVSLGSVRVPSLAEHYSAEKVDLSQLGLKGEASWSIENKGSDESGDKLFTVRLVVENEDEEIEFPKTKYKVNMKDDGGDEIAENYEVFDIKSNGLSGAEVTFWVEPESNVKNGNITSIIHVSELIGSQRLTAKSTCAGFQGLSPVGEYNVEITSDKPIDEQAISVLSKRFDLDESKLHELSKSGDKVFGSGALEVTSKQVLSIILATGGEAKMTTPWDEEPEDDGRFMGHRPSSEYVAPKGDTVFLCRYPLNYDELEELGAYSKDNKFEYALKLANRVNEIVTCISIRLNHGDKCYLVDINGKNPISLNPDSEPVISDEIMNKLIKLFQEDELSDYLNTRYVNWDETGDDGCFLDGCDFSVIFVTEGNDHWDYNFLKLSSCLDESGIGRIYIYGSHPKHNGFVIQGYESGEYDTGIEDEGNFDAYGGDAATEFLQMSEEVLDINAYK